MWISSRITMEMIIPTYMRDLIRGILRFDCLLIDDYLLVGIFLMIHCDCLKWRIKQNIFVFDFDKNHYNLSFEN